MAAAVMLNRRLIPKLLFKAARFGAAERMVLVTTIGFQQSVEVGDPISQARIYEAQAADELIFVDLDATAHQRETMVEVVRQAASHMPDASPIKPGFSTAACGPSPISASCSPTARTRLA
jgi:imidazole glycerol phosphate synthase subunit HisF